LSHQIRQVVSTKTYILLNEACPPYPINFRTTEVIGPTLLVATYPTREDLRTVKRENFGRENNELFKF